MPNKLWAGIVAGAAAAVIASATIAITVAPGSGPAFPAR